MEQQRDSVRKTYKDKRMPTPAHERALERVVWRCRERYNAGREERKAAWEQCGSSVSFAMQSAQLPRSKGVRAEYRDITAQVLPDVVQRLDQAFHAFFHRVKAGEQPGYPRFQGRNRYNRFTYPQVGDQGGAVLDGGILSRAKIGRIPIRLPRPRPGPPKTVTSSKEADGWSACSSCAGVPTEPLPLTGRATGMDGGLKVCLVTADGKYRENPRHPRPAEKRLKTAHRGVARRKQGSKRWWKAVGLCAKEYQKVQRQRGDFHHKTALHLVREDEVSYCELSGRPADSQPVASSQGEVGRDWGLSAPWGRAPSRPQPIYPRRGRVCLPAYPHLHGRVGRQASGSHCASVHHAGR